jgi:hypothetical protein
MKAIVTTILALCIFCISETPAVIQETDNNTPEAAVTETAAENNNLTEGVPYITYTEESDGIYINPLISENISDYVFFDGIAYGNIANDEQWIDNNYDYQKGDFFGIILFNDSERNRLKLKTNSANILPVGTKFYKFSEDSMIILAETEDGLIPYLMLVEG